MSNLAWVVEHLLSVGILCGWLPEAARTPYDVLDFLSTHLGDYTKTELKAAAEQTRFARLVK